MSAFEDLSGQTIGGWKVLRRAEGNTAFGGARWHVSCAKCGAPKIVSRKGVKTNQHGCGSCAARARSQFGISGQAAARVEYGRRRSELFAGLVSAGYPIASVARWAGVRRRRVRSACAQVRAWARRRETAAANESVSCAA